MARRKRFNGLKQTLKNLANATTGELDPSTLPAGSVIKNYVDFTTGERKITITRTPDSLPGELLEKAVIPFSVINAVGALRVPVSKRSFEALTDLGPSATDFNLDDLAQDDGFNSDFIPAKCVIFKADATQSPTKVDSQITGRKYNPREGASYTLPFGQKGAGTTAADITYAGVAAGIVAALGLRENASFEPEYYPI